jgi:hypothetical protein
LYDVGIDAAITFVVVVQAVALVAFVPLLRRSVASGA